MTMNPNNLVGGGQSNFKQTLTNGFGQPGAPPSTLLTGKKETVPAFSTAKKPDFAS